MRDHTAEHAEYYLDAANPAPRPHILAATLFNVALIFAVIGALIILAMGCGYMFVVGANMAAQASCDSATSLWC